MERSYRERFLFSLINTIVSTLVTIILVSTKIDWATSQDSEFSIADSVQVEVITMWGVVEENWARVKEERVDF